MEAFCQGLDRQAAQLRRQAQTLLERSQTDDGNLTKIRANIREICAAVGRAAARTQPESARAEDFLQKIDQLAGQWQAGLEQAESHGDCREAAIQQVKLEALAQVRADFCRKEGIV